MLKGGKVWWFGWRGRGRLYNEIVSAYLGEAQRDGFLQQFLLILAVSV
jgi:hypothetical protein